MGVPRLSPNICGHQDRKHRAKGRCSKCYDAFRRGGLNSVAYNVTQRTRYKNGNGAESMRQSYLKATFGLSLDDFDAMVKSQNGRCAICGEAETATCHGRVKKICIDHNHKTGRVRGLLCQRCNQMIGRGGDNVQLLKKAIVYLQIAEAFEASVGDDSLLGRG